MKILLNLKSLFLEKTKAYKIGKVKFFLEVHKNFKNLLNKSNSTIFAILNGKIIDNKGRNIISYGDIKNRYLKKTFPSF